MQNEVVVSGVVYKLYETRYTPAGIPITRFVLEHQSEQSEAGLKRNLRCQVFIIASGNKLQDVIKAKNMKIGSQITVKGYLDQITFKGSNPQLCVNAEIIRWDMDS